MRKLALSLTFLVAYLLPALSLRGTMRASSFKHRIIDRMIDFLGNARETAPPGHGARPHRWEAPETQPHFVITADAINNRPTTSSGMATGTRQMGLILLPASRSSATGRRISAARIFPHQRHIFAKTSVRKCFLWR